MSLSSRLQPKLQDFPLALVYHGARPGIWHLGARRDLTTMTGRTHRLDAERGCASVGEYTNQQQREFLHTAYAVTTHPRYTPDPSSAGVRTTRTSRTLAALILMLTAWFGGGCSPAESPQNKLDADIEILSYLQDTVPIVRDAILKENQLVTELDGGTLEPAQKAKYIEEKILPVEQDLIDTVNRIKPTDPELKSAHREAALMAQKGVAALALTVTTTLATLTSKREQPNCAVSKFGTGRLG